jgi:hypothetical protein
MLSYDYTDRFGYILCENNGISNVLQADLNHTTLTDITTAYNLFVYTPGGNLNNSNTITLHNNLLYFTYGYQARLRDNIIYFLSPDYTALLRWDTTLSTVTTAFQSRSKIADYNIDFNGNIWLIDSTNGYYSFTSTRNPLVFGTIPNNSTKPVIYNFVGDGVTTTFTLTGTGYSQNPNDYTINYAYTTTLSSVSSVTDSIGNVIRTLSYTSTQYNNSTYISGTEFYIDGNQIIFYTAPGDGYALSGTTTLPIDTFSNARINFISEYTSVGLYQAVLLTRSGYDPLTLSASNQFTILSLTGVPILTSVYDNNFVSDNSLTNDDYLATEVNAVYGNSNLNVKAVLTNVYNNLDNLTVEIITSLSGVDPGPHHFAVRFDSYHGEMTLFIDGQDVGNAYFEPRKYKFSSLINRPFMFGTTTYKNNIPLYQYLQKQSYLVNGLNISKYNIYNRTLNDYDIKFLARQGMNIQDINVDIPCGRRNYVEEIERYFKATVPGSKSTLYNLNITNTGITDKSLQQALATRILAELKDTAPAYSQINSINWI